MEFKRKVLIEDIEKVVIENIADEVRECVLYYAKKYINTLCSKRINIIRGTLFGKIGEAYEISLKNIVVWKDMRRAILDSMKPEESLFKRDIEKAIKKCMEKAGIIGTVIEEDVKESESADEQTTDIDRPNFDGIYELIAISFDAHTVKRKIKKRFKENVAKVSGMEDIESIIMEIIENAQCMRAIKKFIAQTIKNISLENMEDTIKDTEKIVMEYIAISRHIKKIEYEINEMVEHYVKETLMGIFAEFNTQLINECTRTGLIEAGIEILGGTVRRFVRRMSAVCVKNG